MTIALWILAGYGFTLGCWVLYVAAMNFNRVDKAGFPIHWFVRANAKLVWFIALPVDLLLNLLWSVILLDFPRELILSSKLKRLKAAGGWRGTIAAWTCQHILNPFDRDGHHC